MRNRIGRLNANGSLDTTFNPGANDFVQALGRQLDGKILVGGTFTMLGGGTGTTMRSRIGRLHPDGSLDTTFNPGANDDVNAVSVLPDGKVLVGGTFTALGGGTGTTSRNQIGRLTNTNAAIHRHDVACPGCVPGLSGEVQAAVTWARSGAGPEVERVTVELSSEGATFGPATNATRVPGGWQVAQNVSSNVNRFVRARGYYPTGWVNGSGSMVESTRQVYIACPTIESTSLPVGALGVGYSTTLTASNALGVVSFSTTSVLPTGVMLSPSGVLAGTPTQTGTFPVTVTAVDGSSGCAGSRAYSLTINLATAPTMALDKTALRFGAVTSGAAFVSQTAPQIVRLTQSGAGSGDMDGDVESAVAAGEPDVWHWVSQPVGQRDPGRRVAGRWHGGRRDHGRRVGRLEHAGPDQRDADSHPERHHGEPVRLRRYAAEQRHRRDGGDAVHRVGARRHRGDARDDLPSGVRGGSGAGGSELRRRDADLRRRSRCSSTGRVRMCRPSIPACP